MQRKTTLLIPLLLLVFQQLQACICVTKDLIGEGLANHALVFEASLESVYEDPDLVRLVHQEFYVLKVHRYWNEGGVPEYIVVSNATGNSCSAYLKGKTGKWIITANRDANGLFPVSQCNVLPLAKLTPEMLAKYGKGQTVPHDPAGNPYAASCNKTDKLQASNSVMTGKIERLEQEKLWYLLFFQSFWFLPFSLIIYWMGHSIKFTPVAVILKSIAFALFFAVLFTDVAIYLRSAQFSDVKSNDSFQPGLLGISRYWWDCLVYALILIILTLPALLNRMQVIRKRTWLSWLTYLLFPGILIAFSFPLIGKFFGPTPINSTNTLNIFYPFIGILYLAALVYHLIQRRKIE